MLLKIVVALVAVVAAFAAFIALQPSEYRVVRSATIAAPAPEVFAQVNDFHKWDAWSPWAKLDPNAKATFEGAPREKARSSPGPATARSAKDA